MTSDRHTDRQTYILPLVVLSAALQQKIYFKECRRIEKGPMKGTYNLQVGSIVEITCSSSQFLQTPLFDKYVFTKTFSDMSMDQKFFFVVLCYYFLGCLGLGLWR